MSDLIRRSDAICAIYDRIKQIGKDTDPYVLSIRQAVRDIPAVDAVEVRHSYWEDVEVEDVGELTPLYIQSIASMRCASCNRYHNEVYYCDKPKKTALYCPYCGDRMDGRREDGDNGTR